MKHNERQSGIAVNTAMHGALFCKVINRNNHEKEESTGTVWTDR